MAALGVLSGNMTAQPWLAVLLLMVPLAITLEGLVQTFVRRQRYDWRAFAASVTDAVGRRAILSAAGLSLATPVLAWAYAHRIHTIELVTPAAFALLFVTQEFCYYWYHRAAHRIGWFWASHSVHHSPNDLTLAAALRLGWTGKLTGTTLFFAPLVWLGFSPALVLTALAFNLQYQFWLHAPWMPRLGPLEWVFNTPTHHKLHHASNAEYLDRNYGGVLIIFDRLFGTFATARPEVPIRYGLTTPLHSYNPLRIALHGWLDLAQKLVHTHGAMARIKILLGPPRGN